MAHNLNIGQDGKANMFYTGERPWHGLGEYLNNPATAKEAITAARLDYNVEKVPVMASFEGANSEIIGRKATLRTDTKKVLGIVGDGYKVVNNAEAFSFFDTVIGEGQAVYHSAGALGAGERIWLMAKLPKAMTIQREDIVEKYLLLTNSHDGTSALKLYFTPVRVVCQNTLTASLKNAREGISIRHSGNIESKVGEARRILGLSIDYYTEFEQLCKKLSNYKMTDKKLKKYFEVLTLNPAAEKESAVAKNRLDDYHTLFNTGKGNQLKGVKGTAWAAYNAVTEYWDWKTIKGDKEDGTNRLKSIWFGNSARMKEQAFAEICKVAII